MFVNALKKTLGFLKLNHKLCKNKIKGIENVKNYM